MKKTKAQLLRDLKSGEIALELVERYGNNNIIEKLKGVRKIKKITTNSCSLINENGDESWLEIPKASLLEYTDDTLSIFIPGYRPLNQKEKEILKEWEKIANTKEYKEQELNDLRSDGNWTYWQKRRFFENNNALYLFTNENGRQLDYNKLKNNEENCLLDPKVRGERILMYNVIHL